MKNTLLKSLFLLACLYCGLSEMNAQYTVDNNQTAVDLANELVGEGVTILSPTLDCDTGANGIYQGTGDLGIDTGIILTSGDATLVFGPCPGGGYPSDCVSTPGDGNLNTILPGITSFDACILEFDFVPQGDTIKFDYIFASAEYQGFSCSGFNDVFGFFITGGSYVTPFNMATIPGTSIPICVNSTTGVGPWVATDPDCTGMGPGSPFSMYYVDNSSGLYISYYGFTTIFQAIAEVDPCDTYHLKLAIGDGGDCGLDSGVFLKAGSLTSTVLTVETFGGAGLEVPFTNCVRGCPPGKFKVSRTGSTSSAVTVDYTLAGTGVNGVDYEFLPGSVVIPAGLHEVEVEIVPTILPVAVGPKTVIVNIMSPYTCGGEPEILSTDTIIIFDSLYVNITQPDTAICIGESVDIHVDADTIVNLVWTPVGAVTPDPTVRDFTATPTATTTYTATVNIEGVACPAATDQVTIYVKHPPEIIMDDELIMCLDGSVMLDPTIVPAPDSTFTYNWTPSTGLSSTTIRNPTASPTLTTVYYLTANSGAVGCNTTDSIRVQILPNDIELLNNDTVVCAGTVLPLNAAGHPAFTYRWTPETDVVDPYSQNTAITATTSGPITITASHEGCPDMAHSFYLEVQPVPDVELGPDRVICSYDTVQLVASTTPVYDGYSYEWTPGDKLSDSTIKNPVFQGYNSETLIANVTTSAGCFGADTINITVNSANFASVNISDTGLCPIADIQLEASGAMSYKWIPAEGLSADSIPNPVATPDYSMTYLLLATSPQGCIDSKYVNIELYPEAVSTLPDSVQIWPGESYEMDMVSNAHYFNWFPPEGLSATNIPNPVARPDVRTRYFVDIRTENGCTTKDSIDIVVNLESIFDVPNAFVPGNSNVNNGKFKILRRGDVELVRFAIYNRWGNKVFETTDINEGWDGTFNSEAQPMGVYLYQVEGKLNTGRHVNMQGNVTLVR